MTVRNRPLRKSLKTTTICLFRMEFVASILNRLRYSGYAYRAIDVCIGM